MHISDKRKWLRYGVSAAFLIIVLIFARAVWPIIAPFIVAVMLAYLVNPWLKRTARLGIPLIVALVIFYLYVFLGIYCIVIFTVPIITEQLQNLFAYLPQLFDQLKSAGNQILPGNEAGGTADMLQGFGKDISQSIEERLIGFGDSLAAKVMTLPKLLVFFVLSPFLSYYFLRDKKNIVTRIMSLIAPQSRVEFFRLMRELDHLLRQFVSGYLLISLIIGGMSAVFYYIVGLDYALLLGVFMGIAELIPYIGPYLGAIPAILVALSVSQTKGVIVIIGIIILQQIEGVIITPRVIDNKVGIHPLLTIFAVLAGGYLWGIVGAIIAVPLTAVLILVIKYLFSNLFANNYLRNSD